MRWKELHSFHNSFTMFDRSVWLRINLIHSVAIILFLIKQFDQCDFILASSSSQRFDTLAFAKFQQQTTLAGMKWESRLSKSKWLISFSCFVLSKPNRNQKKKKKDCDRIFVSSSINSTIGVQNGTFSGPNFTTPFHTQILSASISSESKTEVTHLPPTTTSSSFSNRIARQCIYTFIAGPNERVKVSFTKFNLRSESAE